MRNREQLQDDYLYRTRAAVGWLCGNSEEEAI
jgi:hypothetical protein